MELLTVRMMKNVMRAITHMGPNLNLPIDSDIQFVNTRTKGKIISIITML